MGAETPWTAGRLGRRGAAQRLLFGQMYEDYEIEQEAFRGCSRVFCIASAGCTAMALRGEHEVVACDINPAQLAYAQRRAGGGAPETGEAERAMSMARAGMPLVGWTSVVVRTFLGFMDVKEQAEFWREHLDTRRLRAGFDVLMSPPILRLVYAPAFLEFLPPRFGGVLRRRLERNFARHPNLMNPYAQALFSGPSGDVRSQTTFIQFVLGDAVFHLESCTAGAFEAFSLSNILDGATPAYRARLSRAVRRAASKDAVVVLRSFGEPGTALTLELTRNRAADDRAMLWGEVDVRSADSL